MGPRKRKKSSMLHEVVLMQVGPRCSGSNMLVQVVHSHAMTMPAKPTKQSRSCTLK